MLTLSSQQTYYVYKGYADMRKGFDGLSGIVRNELLKNPCSTDVFVFFNRSRTHVKLLCWEGDGYSIYYKRLEKGTYELAPPESSGQISSQVLSLILQGIVLSSVRRKKRLDFAA